MKALPKLVLTISFLLCALPTARVGAIQIHDRLSINGYSSFEFEIQLQNEGAGDPNGSFDADLFDLVLNFDVTERLRVAADLTWEHGTATEDDRGNVAVEYAFGEYTLYDWLRFRAGKSFIHFGIYNEIHTAKPAFLSVKEPLSTNKNNKFGSQYRFYPRWGTGMAVLGDWSVDDCRYDYIVQITNGDQEKTNPYEEDDNQAKAISARLRATPSEYLRVGVSAYTDRLEEWSTNEVPISVGQQELASLGAQLEYQLANLGFEIEYVVGTIARNTGEDVARWAATAMLSYRLGDAFTPYVRYEFLEPDSDVSLDEAMMVVYGCNMALDHGLFLKVELNSIQSKANNSQFEGMDYDELKCAVAISF